MTSFDAMSNGSLKSAGELSQSLKCKRISEIERCKSAISGIAQNCTESEEDCVHEKFDSFR